MKYVCFLQAQTIWASSWKKFIDNTNYCAKNETKRSNTQARNQLGTPGGANDFLRGAQIFFNYVQYFQAISNTFFQEGQNF